MGVRTGAAPDDLGERRRDRRGRGRAAGQPAHVRPGRRRRRRHLGRPAGGLRQRDHARRRRHVGRHRPRAGGPAAHEAPARHEGRAVPGDDPDGRRRHDRRRRRLDRLRRRAAASSASARARRAPIPGPAAYGRGGTEPTATDAMVNLGWLLAGGRSSAAAWSSTPTSRARRSRTARPSALGMTVEEASMGAVQILTHSMVQSIEENSVRKGYDPRDFALVAEGGAGPLFAAQIALEVGTPWVLVPPLPGRDRGARAARDRHGLRVRRDRLPARSRRSTRRRSQARSRSSRSRRGPSSRRTASPPSSIADPARRRLPLPRPGLRAAGRRRRPAPIDDAWVEKVRARLPRHPRARVLAPLRGVGHRDPEHPRARRSA